MHEVQAQRLATAMSTAHSTRSERTLTLIIINSLSARHVYIVLQQRRFNSTKIVVYALSGRRVVVLSYAQKLMRVISEWMSAY